MNIPPIKNNLSFFIKNKKIKGNSLKRKKKQLSAKGINLEKQRSLTIFPVESVCEDSDFIKQNNEKIKKLVEREIFTVGKSSNLFSSEILYDDSLEAFIEAKQFYESKDKLLKQNLEQANRIQENFLRSSLPDVKKDNIFLSNNQKKRIFDISSSINFYMSQSKSPFINLKISEKKCGLIFSKQKVESIFKKCCFRFRAFFEKKTFHSYDNSLKRTSKKLKDLANKVGNCFANYLKLNLVKDSNII